MHPSGYAGRSEKCPDWEAGDKYKRDLEITRTSEFRSLSDSVRERIQATQEQMRLAGNIARSSPGRRTIEGGQVLEATAFAIRIDPREFNRIRGIDFRRALFGIALEGFSGGTQERRVTGVSEANCVLTLDRPLDCLPRHGSNWVLFQEVDRPSDSDFRESPDRYRVIAGGHTTRSAAVGSSSVFVDLGDLRHLIGALRQHSQGNHIRRFKLALQGSAGMQEYFVSGLYDDELVLHCPLVQAIEVESNWVLLRQESESGGFDVTSRNRALEQARRLVRSEFPEFTGRRATCGCLMCQEARLRSELDENVEFISRRLYSVNGFPTYNYWPQPEQIRVPRVEFRMPRMSVQATNTAPPVEAKQGRLRSALQDLSRVERELNDAN